MVSGHYIGNDNQDLGYITSESHKPEKGLLPCSPWAETFKHAALLATPVSPGGWENVTQSVLKDLGQLSLASD